MTVTRETATQSDLANIVAQARSLSESLREQSPQRNSSKDDIPLLNDERLKRWCEVVSKGDLIEFQKRLQLDGLNINSIRSSLTSLPLTKIQPLPSWAITLERIIQTASEWEFENKAESQSVRMVIDPKNPLPFEDLFLPALHVAHQQLIAHLKFSFEELPSFLSPSAYRSLQRNLLRKLISLCEQVLDVEFTQFRPFGYRILSILGNTIELPSEDTQYRAFIHQYLQEGMLSFFQKYPILGRLLATQINFWVEATAEFFQRLDNDYLSIQEVFQPQGLPLDLGNIIEIEPSLSDPHHQGRSVIALRFASGLKLVYKPKSISLEVAYNQLLNWCNQHGSPLPWRVLKVIDCQTYGWVEYVEQLPCENEAAAKRFYRRSGMLLCLLYILGANDCHQENLIASGEHLMLIDMETLMHPEAAQIQDASGATIMQPIYQKFWNSVLRTGLLPRWLFNGRVAFDISGLGGIDPQMMPSQAPYWKFINRDDMHRVYKDSTLPVTKNIATLNGIQLSPSRYLNELIEGFEQFYHFLREQRQALLTSSALAALEGQSIRFLFRATNVYSTILRNALAPKFLQHGVDRSIELNVLARAFLVSQNQPKTWAIFHEELNALEQSDIPYFSADSDSTNLRIGQDALEIENYFEAPSFGQAIARLQKLDESNLLQQIRFIQEAFNARSARSPEVPPESSSLISPKNDLIGSCTTLNSNDYSVFSPLTHKQLLSAASVIADKIQAHAFQQDDGSVYWIGLNYITQAERFQLQPLDMSLYSGNCGIALFLAALDYIRGTNQFHEFTLYALQNLKKVLQTIDAPSQSKLAQKIGIGGINGIGSMIYALVKINDFLDSPSSRTSKPTNAQHEVASSLLQDAQLIAQLFTPELITSDRYLDLMSGSAGAILGLLALYRATGDQMVLEKAFRCGQHLLENRASVDGLPRAWKRFDDSSKGGTTLRRPLTGFSHGAAGITYALLQLYTVTQNKEFLAAAIEGIDYEHSTFLPAAGNWSDFRSAIYPQEASKLMVSWCNGATGIGLGRLGSLSILSANTIYEDIEIALQTTQNVGLNSIDQICCGNFGRIELLVMASQKLSRPKLLHSAKQQAAWLVARAEQVGGYSLTPHIAEPIYSPNFFTGTAGIGYELLRLAFPEVLPSVLLME